MATPIPRYIIMWRHNGENHWEAVSKRQYIPFLEKLLNKGVNPASIFFSSGMTLAWSVPTFHKGCSQVWISEIYQEINGTSSTSDYTPPAIPEEKPSSRELYGFISPDGRHFPCDYGGHAALARKIVGSIQKVDNAEKHLEDLGWLIIYRNPIHTFDGKYSCSMGAGRKLTDDQLKTIERIGLPTNARNLSSYL